MKVILNPDRYIENGKVKACHIKGIGYLIPKLDKDNNQTPIEVSNTDAVDEAIRYKRLIKVESASSSSSSKKKSAESAA